MTDPITTALRGRDNFTLIKLPWAGKDGPSVRLQILSDWEEMIQITRAQAWCDDPGSGFPPIADEALRDHAENTFVLWYALRHPDKTFVNARQEDEFERLYEKVRDLQDGLSTEQVKWLFAEYMRFRKRCSPFATAAEAGSESLNELMAEVRAKFTEKALDLWRFKLWFCAKHGVLLTEQRFRDMTDDQWILMRSVTPNSQLIEVYPDVAGEEVFPLIAAPIDTAATDRR
jgi:hypothetical protein